MPAAKKRKPPKTEILKAVEGNRADELKRLLDAGADPNAKDVRRVDGRTPLHTACMNACSEVVRYLLEAGADVNAPDARGRTPLYMAYHSCFAIVQALIEAGANVNAKDIYGHATLHHAAGDGRIDILQLLIDRGADVNAVTGTGLTPLHSACRWGKPAAARLLMASGACVEARGSDGYSPLDLALNISWSDNSAREEIINLFREYAPDLVMEAYCTRSPGGMR